MAPPCEVIWIYKAARQDNPLPRFVLAEFSGTLALVFIGCGSCVGDQGHAAIDDQPNTVRHVSSSWCTILNIHPLVTKIVEGHSLTNYKDKIGRLSNFAA